MGFSDWPSLGHMAMAGFAPPLELHGIGPPRKECWLPEDKEKEKKTVVNHRSPTPARHEDWFMQWNIHLAVADNDG